MQHSASASGAADHIPTVAGTTVKIDNVSRLCVPERKTGRLPRVKTQQRRAFAILYALRQRGVNRHIGCAIV
jgi:hypothetical protein